MYRTYPKYPKYRTSGVKCTARPWISVICNRMKRPCVPSPRHFTMDIIDLTDEGPSKRARFDDAAARASGELRRVARERDRMKAERDFATLERNRATLERDRMMAERDSVVMDNADLKRENADLKRENDDLKRRVSDRDSRDCVVCLDGPRLFAFRCMHLALCATCARKVTQCPVCRKCKNGHKLRVYL